MADNSMAGMDDNISDAFEKAIYEGLQKGVLKLRDSGTLARTLGDAMRGAMFSGIPGGKGAGILPGDGAGTGGGGGIGDLIGTVTGNKDIGSIFGTLAGGGGIKDILQSFLGGASAGGPLGMLTTAFSLFQRFNKKATNAPMSKVDPIFNNKIDPVGDNLGALMGSNMFKDAAFSSRNANGELLRKFASVRTTPQAIVHIQPSREFDAISEEAWIRSSKRHEMGGIPTRTNFNHG